MTENENLSGLELLQKLKNRTLHENNVEDDKNSSSQIVSDLECDTRERRTETMPSMKNAVSTRQTEVMPEMSGEMSIRQTEVMSGIEPIISTRNTETMPSEIYSQSNKHGEQSYGNPSVYSGFTLTNLNGNKHYKQDGKRVGHGGTADIYRVICIEDGKTYIAKVYQEDYSNVHIDEFYDVFFDKKLVGLINILDHGIWNNGDCERKFYIIPDYSELMNLREYIQKYDATDDQIIYFIKVLTEALHTLHVKGFFHRDIKPENILCDEKLENIILIDYGSITKGDLEVCDTKITRNIKKTDGYTAPEIYLWFSLSSGKEVQANEKTDFFALGVVIGDIYKSREERGKSNDTHLFRDDKEASIASQKNEFPFPDELRVNERMLNLVHALLLYEPQNRAGYNDVMAWMAGEVLYIDQTSYAKENQFEYTFNGTKYDSPNLLARGLAENWGRALKEVNRGELLNRFRSMNDDYKKYADGIADIEEFYQKSIKNNADYEDSMLLEIIEWIGGELPFCWKGVIYENEAGNVDTQCLINEIYEDVVQGNDKFNSLVKTRSLKELLYPQIRYINESSSIREKEQVGLESKMAVISSINNWASDSINLAKLYVVEKCNPGFLVKKLTDGHYNCVNDYLKSIFKSEIIDQAFDIIYTKSTDTTNEIIKFMDFYFEREEIRAMLMATYNSDIISTLDISNGMFNSLLQLLDILLNIQNLCDKEEKRFPVDIAFEFVNTCFFKTILGYAEAMKNWLYVDYMEANVSGKIRDSVFKYVTIILEIKQELENGENPKSIVNKKISIDNGNSETYDFFSLIVKFIPLLENAVNNFVSDDTLLKSGLIIATSENVCSYIAPKDDDSQLCQVEGKFIVPKKVAKEVYEPLQMRISNMGAQKDVREYSINICKKQMDSFYMDFQRFVKDNLDDVGNCNRGKFVKGLIFATLIEVFGIFILLSVSTIFLSEAFKSGDITKGFAAGIAIINVIVALIIILFSRNTRKCALKNIHTFDQNRDLLKYSQIIENLKNSLDNMKEKHILTCLEGDESQILKFTFSKECNVTSFLHKYNLSNDSSSYYKMKSFLVLLLGILGSMMLIFSHIPACYTMGALYNEDPILAYQYVKKGEQLTPILQEINQLATKFSIFIGMPGENAKSVLIGKYNNNGNEKEFQKEKKAYLNLCESVGYNIDESIVDSLNVIVDSKKSYNQGIKLYDQGEKRDAVLKFNKVISEDSNFEEAQEYVSTYVESLYKLQQKYIETGKRKKLKKLLKVYDDLNEANVTVLDFNDIYSITSQGYDISELEKHLVAFQMEKRRKEWKEDKLSGISCVKVKNGCYYVEFSKDRSGLKSLFSRYETVYWYCFTTNNSELISRPDSIGYFDTNKFDPDDDSYYKYVDSCYQYVEDDEE